MLDCGNGQKSPISFYESSAEISSDALRTKLNHVITSVIIAGTITQPSLAVILQLFEGKSEELQINKFQL